MAVRDDFAPGEVLAAADLNDTFASKLPYSFGTATPSTTDSGFLWYDSNSTPAQPKFWNGSSFISLTADSWTTYTPSWTNLTVGNGTNTAAYVVLGKLVIVSGYLEWGSTTSATTSSTIMTAPFSYASGSETQVLGAASIRDVSVGSAKTLVLEKTGGSGVYFISNEAAANSTLTGTSPYTLQTGDVLRWALAYERA